MSLLFIITVNVLSGFVVLPEKSRYSATSYGEDIVPYSSEVAEIINFTSKEETYIETKNAVPFYTPLATLPNSCGPTAGAIIVGFYDKYYEDLIPDYKAYVSSGAYKRSDMTYVPQVMNDLYTLMRTNVDDSGVSEAECKSGLITYFNNHGYNLTLTNIRSNNIVNQSSYTAAINSNKPTLLFCDHMDIYNIVSSSTSDKVIVSDFSGAHVAVGFGLYTVKYYNGSTNFRTDTYLRIATGLNVTSVGHLKISETDWCDAAYVTTVS